MDMKDRVELVRQAGVAVSAADEKRIGATVAASLKSLNDAVKGSLFDTEPQSFDVEMRRLKEARR
jgi:hypothetical protein